MWCSQHSKIYNYIKKKPKGSVFVLSDFYEIAEPKTVSKIMERLTKEGVVSRIRRGVFWKNDSKNICPEVPDLIKALARIKSWEIIPTGDTALHAAGLLKKNPRVWTYLTDGTARDYEFNGNLVSLQHKGIKSKKISNESKLLVEVLKACGNVITDETKTKIINLFSSKQIRKIIRDTKYMTVKFAKKIKNLFKDYSMNKIENKEA